MNQRNGNFVVAGRIGFVIAMAICSGRLRAQVAGGTVTGTVSDPSGAVVPGASIKIVGQATGIERTATTNGEGFYAAPNLNPGNYEITVTAKGFETAKKDAVVTVGEQLTVNLQLQIGNETQIVVQAESAPVELTSSTLSATVGGQEVRELPLNGRDWTSLATLTPGVHTLDTQTSVNAGGNARANRGYGSQLNVSGDRPQQNIFRLDGLIINEYSGGGPGSVLGLALGVEAVQEFSVTTSNASAEYARTSGGVVNAVTRAGTNELHGSAYEFLRNSDLDSRNFFDGKVAPPYRRNQFGAAAGGPVVKNRAFFFFDYEGLRQSLASTTVDTVPSANAHLGNLSAGKVTIDPKVAPYLALYPQPNGAQNGDFGTYSFVGKSITPENLYTGRFDYVFNGKDSIHGVALADDSDSVGPDAYDFVNIAQVSGRKSISIEESHIFSPTFANFARVGASRSTAVAPTIANAIAPNALDTSLGFVSGFPVGTIQVSGLPDFTGSTQGTYRYGYTSYQFSDDAFLTLGVHNLKFGAYVERIFSNIYGTNTFGLFNFGSLKNFLTNLPSTFQSAVPSANTPLYLRQTIGAGYIADDWHIKTNLTLNLGLRYEAASVPTEKYNRLASLASLTSTQPHLGSPLFSNPTMLDFSPRVGLAWDPFKDGKTAIRAAFGIYDNLPLTYEFNLQFINSAPYFTTGTISNAALLAGTFPKGAFGLLTPSAVKYTYDEQNPHRNYVEQWNVTIQRQLPFGLVAQTGYNGSTGVHLPFRANDANLALPTQVNGQLVWPAQHGPRENLSAGDVDTLLWEASSPYNALSVLLSRQLKGVKLAAAYTWSKSIDDTSSSGSNFTNSLISPWPQFPSLFRGLSDFDVRQVFVANSVWDLRGPKKGLMGAVAGGWQLGGIFRMSNGLPFTPTISGDPLGIQNLNPFGFPDRLNTPGCSTGVNPGNPNHYINTACFAFPNPSTRLGNSPRNALIGPGITNFDASLYKSFRLPGLPERFHMQLRAEAFNILNHANFQTPIRTQGAIYSVSGSPLPNGGLLNATSTTSRQLQMALKFIF